MPLTWQPLRSFLLFVSALLLLYGAWHLLPLADWQAALLGWLQADGYKGRILYVAVYVVATLIVLPLTPLAIGAGYIYGLSCGFGITLAAATLGAGVAFVIARRLLRERFHRLFRSRPGLAAVESSINDHGGMIVFLLRLSPIIPSQVLNYLCGITGISLPVYLFATLLGKAPLLFLLCYLGAAAARTMHDPGTAQPEPILILAAGLVTTGLACWLIARGAKRRLRRRGLTRD